MFQFTLRNSTIARCCAAFAIAVTAMQSFVSCRSCASETASDNPHKSDSTALSTLPPAMKFNEDSAYAFIERQIAFGPRVPATEAHDRCAGYLADAFRNFGADTIITQRFTATAYNGDKLPLTNIMARFNTDQPDRILLAAHYDTRPWADREKRSELVNTPVLGANDGASGVAVLMEIARLMQQKLPAIGVDILLTDGEDYGNSNGWANSDTTWCLGTQYWTQHMPADYAAMRPRYGILLDMVGGHYARFHREYISDIFAPSVIDRVWGIADRSGYSRFFVNKQGGSVVDDHLFINNAGIPMADIIDVNNEATGNFPSTWHTTDDNIDGISKSTLEAVGQTVTNVIYYEKPR